MHVHCTDIARAPMMLVAQPTVQAQHLCHRRAERMQVRKIQLRVRTTSRKGTSIWAHRRCLLVNVRCYAESLCPTGLSRGHGAYGIGECLNPSLCYTVRRRVVRDSGMQLDAVALADGAHLARR